MAKQAAKIMGGDKYRRGKSLNDRNIWRQTPISARIVMAASR